MFGHRNDHNTTIIGRGARFVGTLELEGAVHIEGRCEGVVRAQGSLSVGPHGSVVGEVAGNVVRIAGRVEGTAIAQQTLYVLKNGGMKGDAYYGKLQVDCGGVIDGRTHQGPPAVDAEAGPVEQTGVIEARVKTPSAAPATAEVSRLGVTRAW